MSREGTWLVEVSEADVARWAHIVGPSSAAAMALGELERRRAAGEDVRLFRSDHSLIVGPPLSHPVERVR